METVLTSWSQGLGIGLFTSMANAHSAHAYRDHLTWIIRLPDLLDPLDRQSQPHFPQPHRGLLCVSSELLSKTTRRARPGVKPSHSGYCLLTSTHVPMSLSSEGPAQGLKLAQALGVPPAQLLARWPCPVSTPCCQTQDPVTSGSRALAAFRSESLLNPHPELCQGSSVVEAGGGQQEFLGHWMPHTHEGGNRRVCCRGPPGVRSNTFSQGESGQV